MLALLAHAPTQHACIACNGLYQKASQQQVISATGHHSIIVMGHLQGCHCTLWLFYYWMQASRVTDRIVTLSCTVLACCCSVLQRMLRRNPLAALSMQQPSIRTLSLKLADDVPFELDPEDNDVAESPDGNDTPLSQQSDACATVASAAMLLKRIWSGLSSC